MRISWILLAMMLSCGISGTRAQEVIIKAELDTNKALIGDQIKFRLLVDKPANIQVGFPVLKDSITADIEIISNPLNDTVSGSSGRVTLRREFLVSVFDTGYFEIPALQFVIQSGSSQDTLHSLPVPFEIMALKADSTIRDIKDVYRAPISMAEIINYIKENYPLILIVAGAGLLVWYLVIYFRRRKRDGTTVKKETIMEPPEVIALRELEMLKEEKPWLHNKVKHYHIRVSEILRTYIENRFKVAALEQTTDEILFSLKPPRCKPTDHDYLASVLKLADLVKFAKIVPDVEENAMQVELALRFVHDTIVAREPAIQDTNTEDVMIQSNKSF